MPLAPPAPPVISKTLGTLAEGKFEVSEDEKHCYVPKYPYIPAMKVTTADLEISAPATPEKIEEKLKKYGGCIIRNYLPKEDCDQILKDVTPTLNQDRAWDGDFFPPETRRCTASCSKSVTCAEKFLAHPLNVAVSHKFLGKESLNWHGEKIVRGYSPPQYNSCITFRIGPGAKDQVLHRDDDLHHTFHTATDEYTFGRDTALGSVLCLERATKENGATRFIPGSHLWDHFRQPKEEECVYAELEPGDCFFMLASCFHAGSANKTENEYRTVTILFMTQGTLRQEENLFVSTDMEYFKKLSPLTLKLMGWTTSDPFCGWVGLKDPLPMVAPQAAVTGQPDDLYAGSYIPVLEK